MPLLFDIDAHGRVLPAEDALREALADRAGRFTLLPSAPDLLLARRTPAAGGAAAGPRCVLCGDLSAFPIVDLLGFLHGARLSGTLTVSAGGVDRAVLFKDGEVRGAQSDATGERIGEVALRLGLVQPAQVEAVAACRPIGKALVDRGFLGAADLWRCFHEQVTGVFHAILVAREGVFTLVDAAEVELPGAPLAVNTQQLLMDGIRRVDELGLFQARIPGPEAFLRRREPRRPVELKPLEAQLLALVDGHRRVADVAREAHLSAFDATKVLFHLAEAGYVEACEAPAATPAPAAGGDAPARLAAVAAGMEALCREVTLHVAAAHGLEPFLGGVRGFLADPQGRFAPVWAGLAVGRDGTLDGAALLARVGGLAPADLRRLEPSGDPARLLHDALRELLFFELFQAGERLTRDDDEALSTAVKRRLEALAGLRGR